MRSRESEGVMQSDTANFQPKIKWFKQTNKICLLAQQLQLCSELFSALLLGHALYTHIPLALNSSVRQAYYLHFIEAK